jgi:ArsR family transcriptional regulator
LCEAEGVLDRIAGIVARRDAPAREFFAQADATEELASFPSELPAYLATVALLIERRELAIDVGTGDGRLLEAIAPIFGQVVAVDREPARLERAAQRLADRGHTNVALVRGDLTDDALAMELAAHGSPDAVFAARVLHHAPRPSEAVARLASLLGPGGRLLVLDYAAHEEEGMRAQGDVWLGFQPAELEGAMREAGLEDVQSVTLPSAFCGTGPDRHLRWLACAGRQPTHPVDSETIGSDEIDEEVS